MKNMYVVHHKHRFGDDIFLVKCDRLPTIGEIINICEVDFEDGRDDEWITVDPVNEIFEIK